MTAEAQNLALHKEKLVENLNIDLTKLSHNFELPSLLHLVIATIVVLALFYLSKILFEKLQQYTENLKKQYLKPITFKGMVLVGQANLAASLDFIFGISKLAINATIIYAYLTYAFSIFPATRGIATKLLSYVIHVATSSFNSLIAFIPNLLSIIFIIAITYYTLQLGKFLTKSLYFRQIIFPGFKQEWILPTYDITRFFIIAFAVIMIFPYLPGSDSPAFKGVSVFLGILFTLGSGSAISNIIAGIVLIYMSPFTVGDRVKVDELTGDITEMGLLVTRLRTIKNEDITIPNSHILTRETINYSSSAESLPRLILPLTISIGYDINKDTVKALLVKSADKIADILEDPAPFILITELDGSFISYELNVYTENAKQILQIKSDLRESIIENFNKAGIEILSPLYISTRDGNKSTIVKDTLKTKFL